MKNVLMKIKIHKQKPVFLDERINKNSKYKIL